MNFFEVSRRIHLLYESVCSTSSTPDDAATAFIEGADDIYREAQADPESTRQFLELMRCIDVPDSFAHVGVNPMKSAEIIDISMWRNQCLESINVAKSNDDVFDAVARSVASLGIKYASYSYKSSVPISTPKQTRFSNYQHAQIVEVVELYQDRWKLELEGGTLHGWTKSYRDSIGATGTMSCARDDDVQVETCQIIDDQVPWLLGVVHTDMSQRLATVLTPEVRKELTDKERSVLRWSADGKTARDISQIEGISQRTVNFHLSNAQFKLGAINKTHAVSKAIALRLI